MTKYYDVNIDVIMMLVERIQTTYRNCEVMLKLLILVNTHLKHHHQHDSDGASLCDASTAGAIRELYVNRK